MGADSSYAQWDIQPSDRIGPPLSGSRGVLRVGVGVLVVLASAGGWALFGDAKLELPEWARWKPAAPSTAIDRTAPLAPEPAAAGLSTADLLARSDRTTNVGPDRDVALAPASTGDQSRAAAPPAAAAKATEQPPATATLLNAPKDKDGPPSAATASASLPRDAYQTRAEGVGLHPDLSRALLARLSQTDFKNAETAIRKAVAETPDTGALVWPLQRKPEQATFKVHFVPGAAPSCRRYVVTVTKDGWSTTALPMEKCGTRAGSAQRG